MSNAYDDLRRLEDVLEGLEDTAKHWNADAKEEYLENVIESVKEIIEEKRFDIMPCPNCDGKGICPACRPGFIGAGK